MLPRCVRVSVEPATLKKLSLEREYKLHRQEEESERRAKINHGGMRAPLFINLCHGVEWKCCTRLKRDNGCCANEMEPVSPWRAWGEVKEIKAAKIDVWSFKGLQNYPQNEINWLKFQRPETVFKVDLGCSLDDTNISHKKLFPILEPNEKLLLRHPLSALTQKCFFDPVKHSPTNIRLPSAHEHTTRGDDDCK